MGVAQLLWLPLDPTPPGKDPVGPVSAATPAVADSPRDPTPELLVRHVPQRSTTSFFDRRPGPWPAPATGFVPKFAGRPSCDDGATVVADPAPPVPESRSSGTGSPAGDQEYAEHPAHRSSASAPSPPESPPHPRSKARVPTALTSVRTIARSPLLPYPPALAF